jgi:UDP-GlcNAc:undecaprenyl-phosphate GlcNAc-1-phosphate transferase
MNGRNYFVWLIPLALTSMAIVGALTPMFRRIAIRLEVWDLPSESHKTHREPVPYLGGLAIKFGIVLTTFFALWLGDFNNQTFSLAATLLVPAIFMGVIGLLDDIFSLSPWPRFMAQTLSGLVTSIAIIIGNNAGAPFDSNLMNVLVTVLWIVGVCNAVNFLDNIDGGASGAIALTAAFVSIIAYLSDQYFVASLSVVVSGACLGFLFWNKSPARIYMGDAGSLFLGVIIATLAIRLDPPVEDRRVALLIPLLLLSLPILDTTTVVFSRLRRGISPFQGGRDHLSHRLLYRGLSKKQTVMTLWSIPIVFGIISLAIVEVTSPVGRNAIALLAILILVLIFVMFTKMTYERQGVK